MTTHTSLLDLTNQLIHDDSARSAFAENPDGFLAEHGIVDLSPADVAGGLGHVADALPPHLAVQLGSPADAYDGSVATLVDQFRVVSDVDADYTLPQLDLDDNVDFVLDPALDVDPHGALDDAPVEPGDTPEATADPEPGEGADGPVDGPDAGFGSGGDDTVSQLDTPVDTDAGADVEDEVGGFEVAVPDFEDPAAFDDSSAVFDDSFLAPEPAAADPGEADDLDADNGNWDGAWNHDDGHGIL